MENTIVLIVVIWVLISGTWLYLNYFFRQQTQELTLKKYEILEPLLLKLANNEPVTDEEVYAMAKKPSLRCGVFRLLQTFGKMELFPEEYLTHEKGAESFLVSWLEFPTELGVAPDEIQPLKKITVYEEEALDYYVFKFKSEKKRWASKLNWMMGVSGPYRKDDSPYDEPQKIFSRFNPINTVTPESEVEWVHRSIAK